MTQKSKLIHIKFDYEEALVAKKDVLSSEIIFLRMARSIERYNFFRKEEYEFKKDFLRDLKKAKSNILRLQKLIPEPKIPKILKRDSKKAEEKKSSRLEFRKPENEGLEGQMQDIQKRLAALQSRLA